MNEMNCMNFFDLIKKI